MQDANWNVARTLLRHLAGEVSDVGIATQNGFRRPETHLTSTPGGPGLELTFPDGSILHLQASLVPAREEAS